MQRLTSIKWEINSKCNLNCKHCFISDRFDYKEMSLSTALQTIDKLLMVGIKSINFSSKEPLLYNGIYRILEYCFLNGIYTTLNTNGILISDIESAEKLLKTNVSNIWVSMDGISPDSHNYIRGENNYQEVISSINYLKLAQSNLQSNTLIGIGICLTSKNISEVDKIIDFYDKLEVDMISISNIVTNGNALNDLDIKLSVDEYINCFEKIYNSVSKLRPKYIISDNSIPIWGKLYFNIKYNLDLTCIPPSCGMLENAYSIMPDGRIRICTAIDNKDFLEEFKIDSCTIESSELDFEKSKNTIKKIICQYKDRNETCIECIFNQECYLCIATIHNNETVYQCKKYKLLLEGYLNDLLISNKEIRFYFSKNVILKISDNNIIFEKIYSFNHTVSKTFLVNDYEQKFFISIINKKNGITSYLFDEHKDYELFKKLQVLLYNDFIRFKEL